MDNAVEHNHVALLQHQAKNSGNTVLLKFPTQNGSEPPQEWNNITVADFAADVDRVANFLMTELKTRAIPPRSVVTLLWVFLPYLCVPIDLIDICRYDERLQNRDLVYAIALGRATYVPQMCTDRLTHPEIIFELMKNAGSKMILYNPSLEHLTVNCPFPKMPFTPIESIEDYSAVDINSALPRVEDLASGSDVAFVFLTSGSISGSPKLVPLTQKVLSFYCKVRFGRLLEGKRSDAQDVLLERGNICHLPSMIGLYSLQQLLPCIQ
jgi:acyl-CoA synthetase (AMP-forming)/AMP-acid ligase II